MPVRELAGLPIVVMDLYANTRENAAFLRPRIRTIQVTGAPVSGRMHIAEETQ